MEGVNDTRADLSEKQIKGLDKFRENVQDILKPGDDDFYLLRWLRARNYDLKKSEDMLRKSMDWRKKWKADTILTDWMPPEAMKKYFPVGCTGFDKEGCPVWIYPAKNLHMKSISLAVKKSDIIRYNITLIETVMQQFREQSEKLGRRVDKVILIDDLDGFSLRQLFMPGMNIILNFLGMIEANYPETLKTGYIVNGSMIFPIIFRIIKPLLSEHTKKKFVILGRDWKDKVLEAIDPDQLPVYWGGTCTDPDGDIYCQSKICLGGEVPPEYFLKGRQIIDENKVSKATIARGDSLSLKFNVKKAGLKLKWIFWTESYDIKFGVSYRPVGSKSSKTVGRKSSKTIISGSRINCHQVPEDGIHECEKVGQYILKFDNTYSWVHSKALSYCIELLDIDELQADVASLASSSSELPTNDLASMASSSSSSAVTQTDNS